MAIRLPMTTKIAREIGIAVVVKISGEFPNPSDFQTSAEKLSLNSRNVVSSMYVNVNKTMPGQNEWTNFLRASVFRGRRRVRSSSSNSEGGGSLSSSHKNNRRGAKNTQHVTKGIHISETPQSRMIKPPTDFANPAEKIKLTDNPAPSTSVFLRPSRYPKIIPHTRPNGKPFVNKKTIL